MKEIKEKPTERAPKSDSAGKIPKAALKKAWTGNLWRGPLSDHKNGTCCGEWIAGTDLRW